LPGEGQPTPIRPHFGGGSAEKKPIPGVASGLIYRWKVVK
jgi:hypothetical protein